MNSPGAWSDIRDEHVERAGGEAAADAGKRQLLAGSCSAQVVGRVVTG
ncbi:MAG: hypothetical protein ACRDRK_00220 [Pseudonocardia sp.]